MLMGCFRLVSGWYLTGLVWQMVVLEWYLAGVGGKWVVLVW